MKKILAVLAATLVAGAANGQTQSVGDGPLLGQLATRSASVAVAGNIAYVVEHTGLFVVDVSNAAAPRGLARVRMPAALCQGAAARGTQVMIGCASGDGTHGYLAVLDAANPRAPRWTLKFPIDKYGAMASDGPLVAVAGDSEVRFYDLDHLDSPPKRFAISDYVASMSVSGQRVWLVLDDAAHRQRAIALDVSGVPREVGSLAVQAPAFLAAHGNWLAEEDHYQVRLYDVSAPSRPVFSGYLQSIGVLPPILMDDRHLYIGGTSTVQIVDISPSHALSGRTPFSVHDSPNDMVVANGRLYVAAGPGGGLRIYDGR